MIGGNNVVRSWRASVWLLLLVILVGCGSDSTDTSDSSSYTVGGVVTGLDGLLVLSVDGTGNRLLLKSDSTYIFPRKIAAGAGYQIRIEAQPVDQRCTISNGSGTATSNTSDVTVVCITPPKYSIGGSVSGLIGSLTLRNNGGDDVVLGANGSYTFATPIMSGNPYQVSIYNQPNNQVCSISNAAGAAISATVSNVTVNCVADDGWQHPLSLTDNISPDTESAIAPQVAMDDSGNAVVVWVQRTSGFDQVFMSDYNLTLANQWTHPADLTDYVSVLAKDATVPQVAMGRNGANDDVVIVWEQFSWLYMMERRAGVWAAPVTINNGGLLGAKEPQVAMDDNGNTIIVWRALDNASPTPSNPAEFQIYMSEYRGGVWTHPTGLADNISPDGTDASGVKVVMGLNAPNDDAVIVWRQESGAISRNYKSEYRAGAWVHPVDLNDSFIPAGSGSLSAPEVAMDDSGNTVIVWDQIGAQGVAQVFKREYRSGVWDNPVPGLLDNFSTDGQPATIPKVALDNLGNAIITWTQFDGNDPQLFKSEYRLGAWTTPSSFTDNISPDGEGVELHDLAMDNNGDAVIVWRQFDGSRSAAFKSEYRNAAWRNPVSLIDSINPATTPVTSPPTVAMDNNGDALIVWAQPDAVSAPTAQQVYVSEFR